MVILVFHGSEVFDSGAAARLISLLHPAASYVAGVMARTAAEESGLGVIYDGRRPSAILAGLEMRTALLVHQAKNEASAHRFGSLVHSHAGGRSLLMAEPAGGSLLTWGAPDPEVCRFVSDLTGYRIRSGAPLRRDHPDTRSIGGCLPGEPVFVNGIIIGHATGYEAVIRITDGELRAVSGIILKEHGVEKLIRAGCPDISSAWCKSGSVRGSVPRTGSRSPSRGRIMVIDHTAMAWYDRLSSDVCGVLAIGDDTTSVCGHVGCFRGIPVLGITDGDADGIVPEGYAPGSLILEAVRERDDDLGREVAARVPAGPVVWEEWVAAVICSLGDRVRVKHQEPDPDAPGCRRG